MKHCSINKCNNKYIARGYCRRHYSIWWRGGDPHNVPRMNTGLRYHALYSTWSGMIQRCTNEKHQKYKDYGSRGIEVCDRWKNSFRCFLEDMGEKPSPKHTLDRINNNGNYEPSNCKWSTPYEQSYNKRVRRDSVSGVTGVTFDRANNMWRSIIRANGKTLYLGKFNDINEAIEARKIAESKYWN